MNITPHKTKISIPRWTSFPEDVTTRRSQANASAGTQEQQHLVSVIGLLEGSLESDRKHRCACFGQFVNECLQFEELSTALCQNSPHTIFAVVPSEEEAAYEHIRRFISEDSTAFLFFDEPGIMNGMVPMISTDVFTPKGGQYGSVFQWSYKSPLTEDDLFSKACHDSSHVAPVILELIADEIYDLCGEDWRSKSGRSLRELPKRLAREMDEGQLETACDVAEQVWTNRISWEQHQNLIIDRRLYAELSGKIAQPATILSDICSIWLSYIFAHRSKFEDGEGNLILGSELFSSLDEMENTLAVDTAIDAYLAGTPLGIILNTE